jgi:hypothetical protein
MKGEFQMKRNFLSLTQVKRSPVQSQSGRVGYFILWLMGAPIGLLLLLWVLLGNNIFGAG